MRSFLRLLTVGLAAAAVFVSCKKDENAGTLSFDAPAIYIASAGGTATVGFTTSQIKSLTLSSKPKGWPDPVIDFVGRTIVVTAPTKVDTGDDKLGNLVFTAKSESGKLSTFTIFAGVIPTVDLTTKAANSYVINGTDSHYLISATTKGESQGTLAPDHVGVVWQSATYLIEHMALNNGKISFYVGKNGTSTSATTKSGNALIGAYDKAGKLLWSWHLWIADYDPEKSILAFSPTQQLMDRNLGATANANDTNANILASFGLYYQWGRKDPFIGPSDYKSTEGVGALMYSGENKRIYVTTIASDATRGTLDYATANPLSFISGVEASAFDWRWSDHTTPLWAEAKSVNDPCPYGWKVGSQASYASLTQTDESKAWSNQKYGCELTFGGVKGLFMGAGRRIYTDGKFQNVNFSDIAPSSVRGDEGQPWVGLYWTTSLGNENKSKALYIKYGATETDNQLLMRRANGVSVRCVKDVK